ncbi:MAG: metallophosphoesterase [Alphaproteobacteria bacterium]|nr:metallophosphoesterase [Alphaproteobacteria bacterium]
MPNPGPPPSWTGERVHRVELGSVAIIGDVHGRADLLLPLLERLHRPVLVLGDICDRGPDTRECIEALIACGASGVLGNHDLWFAQWASGQGFDPYALSARMGGAATLDSYDASPDDWRNVPRAHSDWVNALHLTIDLDVRGHRFWLAHAGVPSDRTLGGLHADEVVPHLAAHHPDDLLWRKNDPESMLPLDRPIVMGHCPRHAPLDSDAVIAIDTGAGAMFQRLTALLLPERRFITVS